MALPGVRTILKDHFYTLSRTNAPEATRVVVLGRRANDVTDTLTSGDPVSGDFIPYLARNEEQVIDHFGNGSELHRGYIEATSGGASRVYLVPWGSTDTGASDAAADGDLADTTEDGAFNKAFEAAEAVQADIIVPWGRGGDPSEDNNPATPGDDKPFGFVADNAQGPTSLAVRVAQRCKEITDRSNPCFAVMGVTPLPGTGEVTASDLTTHFTFPNLESRDYVAPTSNDPKLHPYVAVVVTELEMVGTTYSELGWSNGAAVYAGYLANIDSELAATGKSLFNVRRLRYSPTRTQQEGLIANGLTPVGQNFSREAVVVDALTFSPATSDFTRVSTLRIVFDAMQLVRRIAEGYVGFPATLHHRNSLDTAITSGLRGMMVSGALIDANHIITYAPRENKATIDLVLTPAFEMRNIEVRISVRL